MVEKKLKYTKNFLNYLKKMYAIYIGIFIFIIAVYIYFSSLFHDTKNIFFISFIISITIYIYIFIYSIKSIYKAFYIYHSGSKSKAIITKVTSLWINARNIEIYYEYKTSKGIFKKNQRFVQYTLDQANIKAKEGEKINIMYDKDDHSKALIITPETEKLYN